MFIFAKSSRGTFNLYFFFIKEALLGLVIKNMSRIFYPLALVEICFHVLNFILRLKSNKKKTNKKKKLIIAHIFENGRFFCLFLLSV